MGTTRRVTYVSPDVGVPLLKLCGVGHRLTADDVDEGQADGGAETSVELLVDLLLIPHSEKGACRCETHNAGPHHNQQQTLQECQVSCLNNCCSRSLSMPGRRGCTSLRTSEGLNKCSLRLKGAGTERQVMQVHVCISCWSIEDADDDRQAWSVFAVAVTRRMATQEGSL